VIYVHTIDDKGKVASSHLLLISRLLSQLAYSEIVEIKKIGKRKVADKMRSEMRSASAANKLISDSQLPANRLKAFILTYRI